MATNTELKIKVYNNDAPVTLAQAVYIGDGTDKTLKDVLDNKQYDFKLKSNKKGDAFSGMCLTFAPQFGVHNITDTNTLEISMDIKMLSGDTKLSYGIHATTLTGIRYTTNMSVSGGQERVLCKNGELTHLSYSGNPTTLKQTYSIIFKFETEGIEFEIYNFSFKINGVEAKFYESAEYMPSDNSGFNCVSNYKNQEFKYTLDDIQRDLLFATEDKKQNIILWGDSITAGDKASSANLCYASLFKTYIETYYQSTVTNLAVSGRFLGQWKGDLNNISVTNSIVFIQIGTNDTSTIVQNPTGFKSYYNNLLELINTFLIRGVKLIMMSATPCSVRWISDRQCKFEWVNRIIKAVANDNNVPFISNHDDLLEYCNLKGLDYSSYLADGVHPNDNGYAWLFNNIINHLGIRRIPDATW